MVTSARPRLLCESSTFTVQHGSCHAGEPLILLRAIKFSFIPIIQTYTLLGCSSTRRSWTIRIQIQQRTNITGSLEQRLQSMVEDRLATLQRENSLVSALTDYLKRQSTVSLRSLPLSSSRLRLPWQCLLTCTYLCSTRKQRRHQAHVDVLHASDPSVYERRRNQSCLQNMPLSLGADNPPYDRKRVSMV